MLVENVNRVTGNRFYLNVPDILDLGTGNVTTPNRFIVP